MAERVIHQLSDDISGMVIAEGGDESIEFAVRGVNYRIDLSTTNVPKFDKALEPYVEAATKQDAVRRAAATSNGRARRRAPASSREQLAAIREWARGNGFEVSERGRIKAEIVEAYNAAP